MSKPGHIPRAAYCHRCGSVTPTRLIALRPDLIANACATCQACRKGKPYTTKAEAALFNHTPTPPAGAEGVPCDLTD